MFELAIAIEREDRSPKDEASSFRKFWLGKIKLPVFICFYMPVSSVKAESVFSHSGEMISRRRSDFTVEMWKC